MVGVALGQAACSSSSKTVARVEDAASDTGGGGTGGGGTGAGGTGGSGAGGGGTGASGGSGGPADSATGGSGGSGLGYADMVLSDGPSLYWRELAGTASVEDFSPAGNDGAYVGCVESAMISAGPTVHLCGGYLQAGDIFDFAGKSQFTFEAWVRPESAQVAEFARIVGKENPVPGPRHGWNLILIGWGQDAGTPSLAFERWASTGSGVSISNPTLPSERFTHVAITYDGATCRIYLNGVSSLEESSTDSILDTTGTFRIGADPFGGSNWRGHIDEIAVYEKTLLADRIAMHYNQGKVEGL
jgi:hypothetical protein